MDYEAKMKKLVNHLEEHPNDYQSVISLLKTHSDSIDHKRHMEMIEKRRRIAEIRAERRARHEKPEQ